jgi:exonuclease SbcC
MRLIRLALTNFRQHADTEIVFRPGLTGIIGPNGAGKSTILEAICWTIYGAPAARGTKDTLRFNRAAGRSLVRAELDFELRGERYRVLRTQRNAELCRMEVGDAIASGIVEVTRQLTKRLGMTRKEFFNTYFTEQKELQFLAAMGPVERARFLSQVLGYERLRAAQSLVRDERKVLKGRVEELQRNLADPDAIARAREAAEARLKEANTALVAAEKRQVEAAAHLADLEPVWRELEAARERDRTIREELRVQQTRLEQALKTQEEVGTELAGLEEAEEEMRRLRERIKPLPDLRAEEERLEALAEAESRRETLKRQLDEQRGRVESLSRRIQEQAVDDPGALSEKLHLAEAECERVEKERESEVSRWQRDQQDVDARLRILRDQAEELRGQIALLEEQGPDGACPTCKRALGAEYDRVLDVVRGQYEEVVQDGSWHAKRKEQLEAEPGGVRTAREAAKRAGSARDEARDALAAAENAREQVRELKEELAREGARARELAGEIAALPEGYDAERHGQVKLELEELRQVERRLTQVETRLERRPSLKSEQAEAAEAERQIRAAIAELEKERKRLGFSEERHKRKREEFEEARVRLDAARIELERAKAEREAASQAAEAARQAERELRHQRKQIAEREKEYRLHNELDEALGALRDELNDRVRPELSELASVFLTQLTDGRYNRIEIDDDINVRVLDEGEEKPVISGGEEDLANLVLRLAISQMIADRAGQTLSLLIFDEVFGGLDEQRRESVVGLLQRLQDRFEQIILITHIESIREGMDQVVRVTYDETTGASTVREESPGASLGEPEPEDLAALVGD